MADEKERMSGEIPRNEQSQPMLPTVNPASEKQPEAPSSGLHPAVYIATWISLSGSVILFNKWILSTAGFSFPITLTCWHLTFATIMTQIMARTTKVLDSRHSVPMTGRVYLRAIVPIGFFFSLSLICGNLTYLYLSVSFIQMLKATMPVAVLLTTWALGVAPVNFTTLGNVSIIVVGVVIASFGEIQFVLIGFMYQVGGIIFEAIRLTMVQRLLSSSEFKMDPLVSLYYFAPACAVMNFAAALFLEIPRITSTDLYNVGLLVLFANAAIAFLLNVSVVFLIGKTSSLVLTLSGVVKDILLVVASMVIFRDPVSPLQAVGYGIALSGLVYYKLGADKLKEYLGGSGRAWSEYGQKHPAMKKLIIFVVVLVFFVLLAGGAFSFAPPELQSKAAGMVGGSHSGAAMTGPKDTT